MRTTFKEILTGLYTGNHKTAQRFRIGLIVFDALTILAFIAMAPFGLTPELITFGFCIGILILLDLLARLWIAEDRAALLKQVYTIADIVVILSLLIAPFFYGNLAFLRILRGLRVIHSYHLLRDLRLVSPFFRSHEDAVLAGINLFVFIFFTASLVFALFVPEETGLSGYVDALYFTVTTLTTTGYGDITPVTTAGKLLSIVIMIVGVALFVQLARAIVLPNKVTYECKTCGLMKHERDAIHCKHCGTIVHIRTRGRL